MTAGFWNGRGWNSNTDSDNHFLRASCVNELSLDILGIAETHLVTDKTIELEGYKWFGNNRKVIHVRARTGSGGVDFFMKNELLNMFDVSVLDDSSERVLWLQLKHKTENLTLIPCVSYLPPENSSRRANVLSLTHC